VAERGGARTNTRVLFFFFSSLFRRAAQGGPGPIPGFCFFFPPFSGGLPRVNTRVGAGQGRVGAGQGRASRAVKINSKK
jgi:hypothetical protein